MVILNEVELQEPVTGPNGLNALNLNHMTPGPGAAQRERGEEGPANAHILPILPMHLQQHHFGGVSSPTLQHMGSLGRKVNNQNGASRPYQRLSTFRPLHGQHADLVRECLEDRLNGPTYETIDPHHLSSHLGYSGEYCATASGSGCSSGSSLGRSTSGCIETILPDPRCYGTGGRNHHHHHQNDYQPVHSNSNNSNSSHNNGHSTYNGAPKQLEKEDQLTLFGALLTVISLTSYVADVATDACVSYFLYWEGNPYWFGLTAAITIIPAITVNAFSIRWYMHDNHEQKGSSKKRLGASGWLLKIGGHLLLLGPVLRYLDLLRYGFRSRATNRRRDEKRHQRDWHLSTLQTPSSMSTLQRSGNCVSVGNGAGNGNIPTIIDAHQAKDEIDYYLLMVHEDRDTALLSLLKSFMESAPQLVLQIYILAKRTEPNPGLEYLQTAAIFCSLFEVSWSLASYHRALRRSVPDKRNMTRMGTIFQFLWRSLTIGSRVLAIALFTSQFGYWVFPIAVGHWGIMTIWVMHQGTRFCDTEQGEPRPCEEYLFNMIIGAIYLFCFLNVKDEPTRYKYVAYYLIAFVENGALITLWYVKTGDPLNSPWLWYHVPALAGVFGAFLLGIFFMVLYYRFFHPNGRPLWVNRAARCC